jgi:GTP-binding protein
VVADIPGIIEGAAEGKGLGTRFLRHIERNSILLFMIAADSNDIAKEYKILEKELKKYNPELLHKRRLLAITKSDLLDQELEKAIAKTLPKKVPHIFISSVTNYNIDKLKDTLWNLLNQDKI